MLDWHGSGMSVMEMSHRGKAFVAIAAAGRSRPARAAGHPGELQGAVPAGRRHGAVRGDPDEPDHARSDRRLRQHRRLVEEGDRRGQAATARSTSPPTRPRRTTRRAAAGALASCTPDAAYLHYTPNETIGGVEFHFVPRVGDVPLVADMSSTILSRPIDVVEVRPDLRRRAEEHRPGGPRAS